MRLFKRSSRKEPRLVITSPHNLSSNGVGGRFTADKIVSSAPKAPTRRLTEGDKNLLAVSDWSQKTTLQIEDPVSIVDVKACVLHGVVAYVGEVHFGEGIWVGVQLTGPSVGKGYNDGSVGRKRYFGSVGRKNGVFCHISKIQRRVKTLSQEPTHDGAQNMGQPSHVGIAEVKYVQCLKKEREVALLKKSSQKKRFQLMKSQTEEIYIQRLKQKSLQELRMSRLEPIEGELLIAPGPQLRFAGVTSKLCKADYDFMKGLEEAQQNYVITDPTLPDNPVTIASQAFQNMTRYTLSEILGKNCRFLQGPKTAKAAVDKIRRAVDEGADGSTCLENYRKDGTTFWNEFFITALRDTHGRIKNYIGVLCEVSAEVAARRMVTYGFDSNRTKTASTSIPKLAANSDEDDDLFRAPTPVASSHRHGESSQSKSFMAPQPAPDIPDEEEHGTRRVPLGMQGVEGRLRMNAALNTHPKGSRLPDLSQRFSKTVHHNTNQIPKVQVPKVQDNQIVRNPADFNMRYAALYMQERDRYPVYNVDEHRMWQASMHIQDPHRALYAPSNQSGRHVVPYLQEHVQYWRDPGEYRMTSASMSVPLRGVQIQMIPLSSQADHRHLLPYGQVQLRQSPSHVDQHYLLGSGSFDNNMTPSQSDMPAHHERPAMQPSLQSIDAPAQPPTSDPPEVHSRLSIALLHHGHHGHKLFAPSNPHVVAPLHATSMSGQSQHHMHQPGLIQSDLSNYNNNGLHANERYDLHQVPYQSPSSRPHSSPYLLPHQAPHQAPHQVSQNYQAFPVPERMFRNLNRNDFLPTRIGERSPPFSEALSIGSSPQYSVNSSAIFTPHGGSPGHFIPVDANPHLRFHEPSQPQIEIGGSRSPFQPVATPNDSTKINEDKKNKKKNKKGKVRWRGF